MNTKIELISEFDYNKSLFPILFENKLTDRIFGMFSNGLNFYKFGWQSTIVKPNVKFIDDIRCSIGIDLIFVVFEYTTGKILLKISLDYFYYDTNIFDNFIFIITELEIIVLNILDLNIFKTHSLTDIFSSIEYNNNNIIVKCINDEVINIL